MRAQLRCNDGGDLGETVEIEIYDRASETRIPVANVLNFDDLPCAEEGEVEEIDMQARALAALFTASPQMYRAVLMAFDFANTCHMLTDAARSRECRAVFEACNGAIREIEKIMPSANMEHVFNKLGWKVGTEAADTRTVAEG